MTASDGTLKFKVIPNGKFILKETAAPAVYILEGVTHTLTVTTEGSVVTSSIDGKSGSNSNTITVKNLSEGTVGNLKIIKTVAGNAADTAKKFDFKVTFSDESETYSYVGYGVSDGTIKSGDTISLAHGDSIIIQGLPKDADYTVTETDYEESGYITVSTGAQGIIEADAVQTASFTNTKNVTPPVEVLKGDLTISKTVSGNGADMGKKFEFTVTFDNAPDVYSYTGNGIAGGMIQSGDKVSLAHGQSITITGLPAGAGYHVEEGDYSAEKYTAVSVGAEGSIEAKTTKVAAFTNTRQADPVTPTEPENPGNSGGSGGGGSDNTDVKSPKVPKGSVTQTTPTDPLVNVDGNIPTGNKVGTPEETVITSDHVPKGTKYGKNSGLPKTGEESNSFKTIYGLFLVFAGLGALFLSLMLLKKTRREK
jgi:LPXTG-motif cell wall-anchored protein